MTSVLVPAVVYSEGVCMDERYKPRHQRCQSRHPQLGWRCDWEAGHNAEHSSDGPAAQFARNGYLESWGPRVTMTNEAAAAEAALAPQWPPRSFGEVVLLHHSRGGIDAVMTEWDVPADTAERWVAEAQARTFVKS